MNRSQLEHLIRAAGDISGDDEIIVLGSMAILYQFPNAPADLLFSNEAEGSSSCRTLEKNHQD